MDAEKISAAYILKHRRSRPWPEASGVERNMARATAKQIRKAAADRFRKACDAGLWKRFSNIILEPKNPFDAKAARRPRQEAVVLGALALTSALLAMYFGFFS
jgi:hypothetical protein